MSDQLRDQITLLSQRNRQQATALAEVKLAITMASAVDDPEERDRALMAALDAIEPILNPPPPPERQCSVCGIANSESYWGVLVDVTVLVHDGEEGYAWIKQLLCSSHFPAIQQTLVDAGFVDHRHGGINFLEDPKCPGSKNHEVCPTPWREDEDDDPYDRPLLVRPRANGEAHG